MPSDFLPARAHRFEDICKDFVAASKAPATAEPVTGRPVTVTFRTMQTHSAGGGSMGGSATRRFSGLVSAPAIPLNQVVFGTDGDDPHQCCANVAGDRLEFKCWYSGIDNLVNKGYARREQDSLVVRWCTANESTGAHGPKGESRTPLPAGVKLVFRVPTPACQPDRPGM